MMTATSESPFGSLLSHSGKFRYGKVLWNGIRDLDVPEWLSEDTSPSHYTKTLTLFVFDLITKLDWMAKRLYSGDTPV